MPAPTRRLDRAGDGRPFIATCRVVYGVALAAAALSIGRSPSLSPSSWWRASAVPFSRQG
ncbi:MAG: hypothetical protein ACRDP6_48700 [Actinoallomurus sp.]